MFTHIAMFKFRADVEATDKERIRGLLLELPGLVPDVRTFSVGEDAGISEGNWDMVVVAGFDDVEGYRAYAAHPDHQPVITEVRKLISDRAGIQFES
jgi:hypothetical protein